jgi:hypothetical protein
MIKPLIKMIREKRNTGCYKDFEYGSMGYPTPHRWYVRAQGHGLVKRLLDGQVVPLGGLVSIG